MIAPRWLVVVVVVVVAGWYGPARAGGIAFSEVHAEADVADEAGAVTLLVHSALTRANRPVVAAPADLTVSTAAVVLPKLGADHALLMELAREGTGLRVTIAILGSDGSKDVSFVRVGDGDVTRLSQGVLDRMVTAIALKKTSVAETPLGALRPFATALRLRSTADAAALALLDAMPANALAVPAATTLLADIPAKVTNPALAVIAARALRDVKRLDMIGAETHASALGARAIAALMRANLRDAEQVLGTKPPRDALVAVAAVTIAESRADNTQLGDRIKEGLATEHARAILAIAATVVPERLTPPIHRVLVGYTEKLAPSSGVASKIGLNAAAAGVEVPRALALVSARDLDDYDVKRLEPLVSKGTDTTSLRLRAELSMRRADDTEAATIAAFLDGAPTDPRALRYHGWLLMGDGRHAEAAAAFAKAGVGREQARALLAAKDYQAALAAIGGPPTSPEELVISMHVALVDKKLAAATAAISIAERAAPVNPVIHEAIIALGALKPDPPRLEIARLIVEKGQVTSQIAIASSTAGSPKTTAGSARTTIEVANQPLPGASAAVLLDTTIDTSALEPLVAALTGLQELDNRTLAIAEIRWEPKLWSFRTTHPAKIRAGLRKLLAAPPYRLRIVDLPKPLADEPVKPAKLTELTADSDAVLIFRLAPQGDAAHVSLMLYQRNATTASQVADEVRMPGLVKFDDEKLKVVLVFGSILLVTGVLWLLRAKGRVKIGIVRAPDVSEDVLCVEITKSANRPRVDDPAAFHRSARKEGSTTKARSATLITSGQKFRIPTGHWHVHLYGAFLRSGQMRAVPARCSQQVQVKRGQLVELSFDLTTKFAEVTVEIVSTKPRGVVVWANTAEHEKVYTDAKGEALLSLPVGTHIIHIDAHGHKLERTMQIMAPKVERLSVNIERERRFEEGIKFDLGPDAEPVLAPEIKLRSPAAATAMSPDIKVRSPAVAATTAVAVATAEVPEQAGPPSVAFVTAPTHYSSTGAGALPAIRVPRASTPTPGSMLLERYRITSELGRGAMGVVHRAWDEKLEREVAIKEMADDLRANPEAMRLFSQEAKALAQLNHTNIVGMYDQITDPSGVYMIMEFVDGQPLEAIVEARGALPWLEAVGLVDQVCAGLAYAHARKVIHRDIKPANIFVANDRTVKLGDFGLARVMREVTIRRTEIRGTPLYMAPEQITGTDVDHRTDLYAIGCTLFELVCGRPPFIEGDILYAQMHLPPPSASSLQPGIPVALDTLLLGLLAKQSDDRPGSANEVRTAFRQMFDP